MDFNEVRERNRKRFALSAKKSKIRANKDKLAKEDYKIIKCAEAIISAFIIEHPDAELPYDMTDLIAKRNTMRDDINAIEAEIKEIEAEVDSV